MLTEATIAALNQSAALVVLCSNISAMRPAVNEEVRLFRYRHPERPVIPVIVDGTFPDNFPPALRFAIAADGAVTDSSVTLLGPDLRDSGDGRSLGLAKLVAGLTGVGTDEIVRRAEREQRRRLRNWITGLSTVVVALAGLTIWAEVNRREAERNFGLAKAAADGLVFDIAQGLRDVQGMRETTLTKILGTARNTFDKLADLAPNNLELQRSRSVMLTAFGDTYRAQGNTFGALESYQEALAISERLANIEPNDSGRWQDLTTRHDRIGDVSRAQGNLPSALESYRKSLAVRQHLSQFYPNVAKLQRQLSVSHNKIGDVLADQGNLIEALVSYRTSIALVERLVQTDPRNGEWLSDLSASNERIGDVLRQQGKLAEALESYRVSFALVKELAADHTDNSLWQRGLSVSHNKVGDVLRAKGDIPAALDNYRSSLAIAVSLTKADPANAQWQRDVGISQQKIGEALHFQGNLPGALESYWASLAVAEHLAAADPSNTELQYGVALSLARVGLISTVQGNRETARSLLEVSVCRRLRESIQPLASCLGQHHLRFELDALGSTLLADQTFDAHAHVFFQRAGEGAVEIDVGRHRRPLVA